MRSAQSGSAGRGDSAAGVPSLQKGGFCKHVEYWSVRYKGNAFRLKTAGGLGYIDHLLRYPHAELHRLDLHGGIVGPGEEGETSRSAPGLRLADEDLEKAGIRIAGDAGEMLDEHAEDAYRPRLSELREEAKQLGEVPCAEQAADDVASSAMVLMGRPCLLGRLQSSIRALVVPTFSKRCTTSRGMRTTVPGPAVQVWSSAMS
jgi:hypothetical protein